MDMLSNKGKAAWALALVLFVIGLGPLHGGCDFRVDRDSRMAPVSKALAEANEKFTYQGKPIHPAIVYQLISWGYDEHSVTASLDLLAAHNHKEYSRFEVKTSGGWIECRLNDLRPAFQDYETFSYKHLGVLADGTHVLYTCYSGGGSGAYCYLIFIRFGTEKAYDLYAKPYVRLLMKVICVYSLGDRDDGEVKVLNDRVIVGKSKHRDKEIVLRLE
jgi:hypothetical protein